MDILQLFLSFLANAIKLHIVDLKTIIRRSHLSRFVPQATTKRIHRFSEIPILGRMYVGCFNATKNSFSISDDFF